jgi:hypothetical protein
MTSCLFPLPAPGCGNGIEEGDEANTCFSVVKLSLNASNTEQIRDAIVLDIDNDRALDLVFIGNTLTRAEDITFVQDIFSSNNVFSSFPIGSSSSVEGASIAVHTLVDSPLPQILVSHLGSNDKNFTRFSFVPEDNEINEVVSNDPVASIEFSETLGIDSVDIDGDNIEEIIFATNLVDSARIAGIFFLNEDSSLSFMDIGLFFGFGENIRALELKVGQLDADAGMEIVIADVDENDNGEIAIIDDFDLSRIDLYADIENNRDLYQQIAMLPNANELRSLQIVEATTERLGDIIAITQATKEVMSFIKNGKNVVNLSVEQSSLEREPFFRSSSVDTPRDLVVGDFDETPGSDLAILENLSTGQSRIIFIMNGEVNNPKLVEPFDGKAATINAADLNEDGRVDFVLTFESINNAETPTDGQIGLLIADF